MKNCEPFVSFPLLAIDKRNSLLCLTAKLSSVEKQSFSYILGIISPSKFIFTPLYILGSYHVIFSAKQNLD